MKAGQPQIQRADVAWLHWLLKSQGRLFFFSLKEIQNKQKGHFVRLFPSHEMENGLALQAGVARSGYWKLYTRGHCYNKGKSYLAAKAAYLL